MDEKEQQVREPLKLDYSLQTTEERSALVKKIIAQTPKSKLTQKYLDILADYIVFAMDKTEKREKKILTGNRMVTVNRRETSFEGLVEKFENGEDGIYGIMTNDKNVIFTPKISITEKDIEEIPELKELRDAVEKVEEQVKRASGKRKYSLKKQTIEMRKDQYVLKNSYKQPMATSNIIRSINEICLDEKISINEDGSLNIEGFSLLNPKHVAAVLRNYARIKRSVAGKVNCDAYYMMFDLDDLIKRTLEEQYPLYYDIVRGKIDGYTNEEIQKRLDKKYAVTHSVEYISSLWKNKIPKLIATTAQKDWLVWYYTNREYGKWKRCSRCGQIKLAHNMFFSKNNTSKDGFYSICKDCRNEKTKEKKEKKEKTEKEG